MKAETGASSVSRPPLPASQHWDRFLQPLRMFPTRLREPRFWQIQVMVLLATAPHYIVEIIGYTNPFETLHGLSITLYIIPLLYAALTYGWEGAVLTGLWSATLTSPSMWIWHRSGYHWLTELGQLIVTLPVGILVAWRVDLETKQRRRAERTSASLRLLNEIGESVSHTMEVEDKLPQVLERLSAELSLGSAWLCLEPEVPDGDLLVIEGGPAPASTASEARRLHRRVAFAGGAVVGDGRTAVVPLPAEHGLMGSLGATAAPDEVLTREQVELLTTVAHQISVAVEAARLYRQRQESMQSYVRQITQAQEDERLRIARDLHDDTAQELVGLVRRLEQLRKAASPDVSEPVDELLTQTRAALQSVRRYSRDLRPSVLDDLGLLAALETVVEETDSRLSGGATLKLTGTPRRLDPPIELALFRIAHEALRNVERHADAETAVVELDFADDVIRLCIKDDGRGFASPSNTSDLARIGKLGLLGMKERAELVGGTFEVRSTPGQGTRLMVAVAPGEQTAR
jgi:signal transduction histidine kinase